MLKLNTLYFVNDFDFFLLRRWHGRVWHLIDHLSEDNVRVVRSKVPLDKFRWVQEVVNLLELILVAGHTLFIDVGDEALAKLLYIVDSYVNIHLLLRLLHEVVLRQTTVDDLLANLVSIIIFLWLW